MVACELVLSMHLDLSLLKRKGESIRLAQHGRRQVEIKHTKLDQGLTLSPKDWILA